MFPLFCTGGMAGMAPGKGRATPLRRRSERWGPLGEGGSGLGSARKRSRESLCLRRTAEKHASKENTAL